jgi:D-alanyl-D-alanine carboxypeptidase
MRQSFLSSRSLRFMMIAVLSAGFIIFVGLGLESKMASSDLATQVVQSSQPRFSIPPQVQSSPIAVTLPPKKSVSPASTSTPVVPPTPAILVPQPKPLVTVKTAYGHLPYEEDDATRLEVVGQYVRDGYARDERLDIEAAQAFRQMAKAAKASGVSLMPLSGFREISVQAELFARQIERKGSKEAAAKWSAPPGHSEHHTGYAIDIADQQSPESDLKISFEDTPAYQWLAANAGQYGFELSFPPNNWQGVSYEPWHWRYVGSTRAMQVFATAKRSQ